MKFQQNVVSSARSDVSSVLKTLNGFFRVKAGAGWINWFLRVSRVLQGGMTSALARSAVVAVRHFYSIYSSQGVRGLVLRTKSMYIMLMQSVGGVCAAPQDLGPGVARSADGLPRVIPKDHRRRIRAGDRYILRIWLSWFSIYRVLVFPGQLKLSTISDPGVEFSRRFLFEMLRMIPLFGSNVLGYSSVGAAKRKLPPIRFFHVNRSTPVLASVKMRRKISTSPLAIIGGIYSLRFSEVWTSFRFLMDKIPSIQTGPHRADGPAGESWFVKIVNEILCPQYSGETTVLQSPPLEVSPIGALGQKLEAAGKIRVFAMVDCWTQWLLAPIHRFVFDLISAFPSDGTFDQLAPVERLIGLGKTKFWCYDLSAATDRLPVFVQSHILNFLFGESIGYAWANLLTGRPYRFRSGSVSGDIKYAVGQPMGALSSWAMLALTHHFIVHWAAYRVGKPFGSFWDYAVLGDDIVLADGKVAGAYLQLMAQLGVGIGVHKSLVSRKGVLEFAKRFYRGSDDCSPVPFKEIVAAIVDFEAATDFVRKYKLSPASLAAIGGWGYKVRGRLSMTFDHLPKRLASLLIWRRSPWGSEPLNLASWFLVQSAVLRPGWLVQSDDMWPELPDPFASAIKALVLKSEERINRLKQKGYSGDFFSVKKYVRAIYHWFDDGLYQAAYEVGPWYNGLYWIQRLIWEESVPKLVSDLSRGLERAVDVRHAPVPLPEHRFHSWYPFFAISNRVREVQKLGEYVTARSRCSPVWSSRLWRYARSWTRRL